MSFKSMFCSLLLFSTLGATFASSPAFSGTPVIGYLQNDNSLTLTLNGKSSLHFKEVPPALMPALEQDIIQLARNLNQLRQQKNFQARHIHPVLNDKQFEIHYQEQSMLTVSSAWAKYYDQSELSTLLKLNNQLRQQLGAPPLKSYTRLGDIDAHQTGMASWYGGFFNGRQTANGERYNVKHLTAAHKKLPFGTQVLVTNLQTKKSVIVKINDRGPFVSDRIIDLSPAAFQQIGLLGSGVMPVKLTVLS